MKPRTVSACVLRGTPAPPAARRRAPTPAVGPEKNVDALKVDFGRQLAALEVVFELL